MMISPKVGYAQITADSIRHFLVGSWEMCGVSLTNYYFDSDSGNDSVLEAHDAVSFGDSLITFYKDGTFITNLSKRKRKYKINKVLKAYASPYKIALGDTEFIFEIRNGGFILERLILATLSENESYKFTFARPGKCE